MRREFLGIALLVLAAACNGTEAAPVSDAAMSADIVSAPVSDAAMSADIVSAPAVPQGVAGWLDVRSADGVPLRVNLGSGPLLPGDIRLWIEVDDKAVGPRSIDLVSPAMPMHGITRYDVEADGDRWSARVNVPMAGDWSVYVNLGDGSDFAEVRFTVDGDAAHADAHH